MQSDERSESGGRIMQEATHDAARAAARQPANSVRSTVLFWLIWVLWLPLFAPSLVGLLQAHPPLIQAMMSVLGALAFFALYVWIAWQSARGLAAHTPRVFPSGWLLWWPVIALIGLAVSLTFLDGYDWGVLFIYVSSGVAGWLPTRKAAVAVVGLVLFIGITLGVQGQFAKSVTPMVFVGIVGIIVIAFSWSVTNSQQLRLAREEMARVAASNEERLRIARDLHDLLGHNLSLIALKSELARRLIADAPERAAAEIGDVEQVARTALQEVREAIANYRTPTLASELHRARSILTAAGIAYRFMGDEPAAATPLLPQLVEAALSWAVREGVTNVIRHSRARSCTLQVICSTDAVTVTITDDGVGATTDGVGNGLRGLAERVAALGGHCESGPRADGGFQLKVNIPLRLPMSEAISETPAMSLEPAVPADALREGETAR
jgi:two-component system, NarL family, sensor histidine kinase DesK